MIRLCKMPIDLPYVKISNTFAQDPDLSYEAKGIYLELMSRPSTWVIRRKQLLRDTCGEGKLRRITDELISVGLLYHTELRDKDSGQFIEHVWMISYVPLTEPQFLEGFARSGFARSGKAQIGISPIGQTNVHIKTDIYKERDTTKKEPISSGGSDEPPEPVCLPKVDFVKRYDERSLPYQLAEILIDMIAKRRRINARYLTTAEGRYLLIQKNAKPFDLLLERDHKDPAELLEVLEWSQEHSFWKDNILSSDKFRTKYEELRGQMWAGGYGSMAFDAHPELTQRLIGTYRALIANPKFVPSPVQHRKFIEGAVKANEFFPQHQIDESNWCDHLMSCLDRNYAEKGQLVHPGHFNSDHTWGVLMPQFLLEAGLTIWDEEEMD